MNDSETKSEILYFLSCFVEDFVISFKYRMNHFAWMNMSNLFPCACLDWWTGKLGGQIRIIELSVVSSRFLAIIPLCFSPSKKDLETYTNMKLLGIGTRYSEMEWDTMMTYMNISKSTINSLCKIIKTLVVNLHQTNHLPFLLTMKSWTCKKRSQSQIINFY